MILLNDVMVSRSIDFYLHIPEESKFGNKQRAEPVFKICVQHLPSLFPL